MSLLQNSYVKQQNEEQEVANAINGMMMFLAKFQMLNGKFANHNQIYRYVKKYHSVDYVPRLYAKGY